MNLSEQVELLLQLHKMQICWNGAENTAALERLEVRLDPSVLRLYRKLKERKGTGIAILKDNACSECMMIYPDTHEILRQKKMIHFCEYCGRLLISAEEAA